MHKLVVAILLLMFCRASGQGNQLVQQVLSPVFVVHFDYNSYQINAEAKRHLDSLLYLMKHETLRVGQISIVGHCDSIGSNEYNDALSQKRGQVIKSYFTAHGINDSLVTSVISFGKRKPLNNNLDSLKRYNNRRVEIIFTLAISPERNTKPIELSAKAPAPLLDSVKGPTLDISKLQVNDLLELKNINFYPNRHIIMHESKPNLAVLLNTMLANKTLRIQIRGHVCCLPDYQADAMDQDTYTEDLSLQRAKEIYLYLVDNGVEPERMTFVGLGGKYPKVREITESDKTQNRRVEIKILSK